MAPHSSLPVEPATPSPVARACLILLLLFLPAFFLWQSRALTSDLSGDPDEAAHAVTALMVRDYLATAFGTHPLPFAQAYYEAYPKVALGHYPPGYYAVTALFLLLKPTVATLLWVQAGLLSLLGFLTALTCWQTPSLRRLAAPASLALICLPPLTKTLVLVMADLLLAAWCLLALLAWAHYLRSPRWPWSLAFGFAAAAAILTKGSGLLLAPVPLIATLLAGRARLLRQPSWWLGALPVVLLAGPWLLFTAGTTQEGMIETRLSTFFLEATAFYAHSLPRVASWTLTLLVLAFALPSALRALLKRQPLAPTEAALWGGLVGGMLLLLLVPAGLTSRYLIPLLPLLLILGLAAAQRLIKDRSHAMANALPWLLSALILLETLRPPTKHLSGYQQAAAHLLATPPLATQDRRWLIASDARGEGAFIAAACFGLGTEDRLARHTRLLRGSKALASSDWLGRDYQTLASDTASLDRLLAELKVDQILIDTSLPADQQPAHLRLLAETVRQPGGGWQPTARFPITRSEGLAENDLLLFARPVPPGP